MNPAATIINGDSREVLKTLPSESVHCVVTSPPYWGLRDYGCSGQIGLEDGPQQYIAELVSIFREVKRVMRKDATLWVNMGDAYAGGGKGGQSEKSTLQGGLETQLAATATGPMKIPPGLKKKSLIGLPWMVAFALQQELGFYLRCDIIWHKPNPMPESTTDRPTRAHEYVFLFSKKEHYFYDSEAIREPVTGNAHARGNGLNAKIKVPGGWETGAGKHGNFHSKGRHGGQSRYKVKQNASFSASVTNTVSSRNKRSVWSISSRPYKDAHFATFPEKLITPCILAGTSIKVCPHCAAPFKRVIEKGAPNLEHQRQCGGDVIGEYHGTATKDFSKAKAQDASAVKARILAGLRERKTTGWKATCTCAGNDGSGKAVVLDPFAGSGTTGAVAIELGRSAILVELNPEYIQLCKQRCHKTQGLPLEC